MLFGICWQKQATNYFILEEVELQLQLTQTTQKSSAIYFVKNKLYFSLDSLKSKNVGRFLVMLSRIMWGNKLSINIISLLIFCMFWWAQLYYGK